jgi:N-methylhydantoinase A
VRAVKAVSTYRGRDPRDFALYAFGGNGPLVAAIIADLLEMKRVVVPPHPGVFSAFGLLHARVQHEAVRGFLARLADISAAQMAERFRALEDELRARMAAEGVGNYEIERYAELRYAGQAHEIRTPAGAGEPDLARLAIAFGNEHERTYGHQAEREEVECVALRVLARVPADVRPVAGRPGCGPKSARKAYFGPQHGERETPVFQRGELAVRMSGPLIVEEYDATCVVPPGWSAVLDATGNLALGK